MKIGLISDTHGYLDPVALEYLRECEEVWHIGDFGPNVADELKMNVNRLRGVYGNIDDLSIREEFPEYLLFEIDGITFCLIHIGGYPARYTRVSKKLLKENKVDVHITGHSHICKVMRDDKNNLLHINPGAAGKQGFHSTRTICTFELLEGEVKTVKIIELGPR